MNSLPIHKLLPFSINAILHSLLYDQRFYFCKFQMSLLWVSLCLFFLKITWRVIFTDTSALFYYCNPRQLEKLDDFFQSKCSNNFVIFIYKATSYTEIKDIRLGNELCLIPFWDLPPRVYIREIMDEGTNILQVFTKD